LALSVPALLSALQSVRPSISGPERARYARLYASFGPTAAAGRPADFAAAPAHHLTTPQVSGRGGDRSRRTGGDGGDEDGTSITSFDMSDPTSISPDANHEVLFERLRTALK
jgi:hypothetical protein